MNFKVLVSALLIGFPATAHYCSNVDQAAMATYTQKVADELDFYKSLVSVGYLVTITARDEADTTYLSCVQNVKSEVAKARTTLEANLASLKSILDVQQCYSQYVARAGEVNDKYLNTLQQLSLNYQSTTAQAQNDYFASVNKCREEWKKINRKKE